MTFLLNVMIGMGKSTFVGDTCTEINAKDTVDPKSKLP